MDLSFFTKIETILHTDRIDAYRRDGAEEQTTLARYLLNIALSEALYPSLQFSEIALRNAVHREMSNRCGIDAWYDLPQARLTPWQTNKVSEAKDSLIRSNKPITPGRIVAELNFGFWTGFFNNAHARTGIGAFLSSHVFPHAPRNEQVQNKLDRKWKKVRDLRNRVFHHERILHWSDLDQLHQSILEIIQWISPELREVTDSLDRFAQIRQNGLPPWVNLIQNKWP